MDTRPLNLTRTDVLVIELGTYCSGPDYHVNKYRSYESPFFKPAVGDLLNVCHALADDLRELHALTGISLDNWTSARMFVNAFARDGQGPIVNNNA
jgi:hypothetical protein